MRELLSGIPAWRLGSFAFLAIIFIIVQCLILDLPTFKTTWRRERVLNVGKLLIYLYLVSTAAFIFVLLLYYDITPAEHYEPVIVSKGDELSVKIEAISDGLEKSARELDTIQEELESRIATVEELKKEAEIAENMISLSEEQVSAIQSKLNQELEASSGKSFWVNVFVSAFFFTLGLIVTPVFNFIRRRLQKTPPQKPIAGRDGLTEEELEKFHRMLDKMARNEFTRVPK